MADGTKRYRHTRMKVAVRRVWATAEKCLLGLLFLCVCVAIAYTFFAYMVICLEKGKIFNPVVEWPRLWQWYYQSGEGDTAGYVPTIFVASISLLLAVITFGQSHYARVQDRAMVFPKNHIDLISIGIDRLSNIKAARKYFDPVKGNVLIKFSFREGFPTYYKAYPYRLFVCVKNTSSPKRKKWERLAIYKFLHSNLDGKKDTDEMLIECGRSRLLSEYCNKADGNNDYRLKIILDIRWTNKLMPMWCRKFSDIYIRQELDIDWEKEPAEEMLLLPYCHRVLYVEHSRAQIASWVNELRCALTIWQQNQEEKKADENRKVLLEREMAGAKKHNR